MITKRIECLRRKNRASKLQGREKDQNIEITVARELRRVCGIGPQDVAIPGAALCVADHALYQVKSDGKTSYERLRGRPCQGQVADFAEVVHFRDPGKAADMPKLDDRWSLGLWLGKSLHQTSTTLALRQDFEGVDPSGGARRNNAGTGRC